MALDKDSEVVMITSAGCNALDYLLDDPKAVHCIDMNPRQNALLELKRAFFQQSDSENLFKALGQGHIRNLLSCISQSSGLYFLLLPGLTGMST